MTAFPDSLVGRHKIARILLLTVSCFICAPSLAADHKVDTSGLPADVRAFTERRDGCDHFRGEDSPDPDRRAQIDNELHRLCSRTDAELARLKRIHARHRAILRVLDEYETHIEVP